MSDDDGIPECGYCYDDRGLFGRFPHLQNDRFFTVKLEETFDVCMYIPCHARPYVLEKLGLGLDDFENVETRRAHLRTKHGYEFLVKLYNAVDRSHFSCSNREALCKAYGFEEGMRIRFDIRPEYYDDDDNIDIWVDVDMPPILPRCDFVKGGHLACAGCCGEHPENQRQCQKCKRGGGFDVQSTVVDAVLSSVRVECPHEGCGLYVTYHKLADPQSVCLLAPCKCPVPVCSYKGPPPTLSHHISTVHPMPVHRIQYSKVLQLQVPLSEPRLLLFAEEDGRAFFLVGGVLDICVPVAVSVVCIRVGASPLPHYVAKLWANGPPGEPKGRTDAIKVEMEVTSSKDPGDVVVQELTFFTVPPKLLAGAGLSRTVSLHIQIDKLTS
ncbi:uncharacterized protein [Aegilops tauschii subsp. strangulata]|uniref:uncharacterized protein n=1 Tax=Aegilops tauschii subsp. strangulata TaxID=200361 RepID=UPI003CC84A92